MEDDIRRKSKNNKVIINTEEKEKEPLQTGQINVTTSNGITIYSK